MNHFGHPHTATAASGTPCVGRVRVGPGIVPGLVAVDVKRPAIDVASARGLLKQFGAAH